jgi:hypothetical protein
MATHYLIGVFGYEADNNEKQSRGKSSPRYGDTECHECRSPSIRIEPDISWS